MAEKSVFAPQENGNLKHIADAETDDSTALLIDAVMDANPRLQDRSFVVLDLDSGTFEVAEVGDEPPEEKPKRNITVQGGDTGGDDEEETPPKASKPKPQRKAPAKKPAAKASTKPKATAKPKPKAAAKPKPKTSKPKPKGKGGFGRKAESE